MRNLGSGGTHIDFRERPAAVQSSAAPHRWGVILAGGDGKRLQPLTRLACGDNRPKQFCPLLDGETLLARTRKRISGAIDPDRVLYVLTQKHEPFYQAELKSLSDFQKIVQPHNVGTLPAILWSLLRLFQSDEDALVVFFPSDHYFADEDGFMATIERSFEFVAKERTAVVLLGAGAERPETEYGWIEPAWAPQSTPLGSFVPVRRFWEKPPLETATELLRRGCLWNTFVMIGSAAAFLEMIQRAVPLLFERFRAALLRTGGESAEQKMRFLYDALKPFDFSSSVLAQSTERLLVASCGDVGWSDLGEPRRFILALTENGAENPWAVADTCSKCGLTGGQIVALVGNGEPSSVRQSEGAPFSTS
jgi:mannose-1-phosphate guanylyltransferase